MKLGEQFRSEVVTIEPGDKIASAVWKMKDQHVGALVVVDKDKIVGILTDRDIALALGSDQIGSGGSVSAIMTRDVITIRENEGVFNATQKLTEKGVRRLPIVDAKGHLVGLVTFDDLFALLATEIANLSKAVAPAMAT